ncbi:MAG: hypothetical protein AAB524_01785 [Patescibacteria group bacterium]
MGLNSMALNEKQIENLSGYSADISKILAASVVIGFFIPVGVGPITLPAFVVGSAVTIFFLLISIYILK